MTRHGKFLTVCLGKYFHEIKSRDWKIPKQTQDCHDKQSLRDSTEMPLAGSSHSNKWFTAKKICNLYHASISHAHLLISICELTFIRGTTPH